jgi:hypothetical protein
MSSPKVKVKMEDLPIERLVELFADMPCEFTEDDFREEFKATRAKERKL